MPAAPAPPTVLSLLIAECTHVGGDRCANLLGIFNGFHAPNITATLPKTWLYMALTDGHGAPSLTLRLLDADGSRPPLFRRDLVAVLVAVGGEGGGRRVAVHPAAGAGRLPLAGALRRRGTA